MSVSTNVIKKLIISVALVEKNIDIFVKIKFLNLDAKII